MSNSSNSYLCIQPGAIKLIQDISKLLNNRQGSDVQFLVGGGTSDSDSSTSSTTETKYNASATVTMYAHSAILRCRSHHFESMFENEKGLRSSDRIIYKPNVSPHVFHKVLEYIYTGSMHAQPDILLDLITAADEMGLEELSIECQANVIKVLEQAFSRKGQHIYGDKKLKASNQQDLPLPISLAVSKMLLPAFTLAYNHTMSDFFQQLFGLAVSHFKTIFDSSYARVIFFDKIPTQIFRQIIASDELDMQEFDVWNLAFSMACHKSNVPQSAVAAHFRLEDNDVHGSKFVPKFVDEEGSFEQQVPSEEQLKRFKDNLTSLLPAIRFSLIEGDQYARIVEILNYVLPPRRSFELQKFHAQSDKSKLLDVPRLNRGLSPLKSENIVKEQLKTSPAPTIDVSLRDLLGPLPKSESLPSPPPPQPKIERQLKSARPPREPLPPVNQTLQYSRIINKSELWLQIMTWIFESNGLFGCRSAESVRFNLLFRASEHDFLASAFHEHCDKKGPTIVVIESKDGYKFGGVNFAAWSSSKSWSGSTSNFLFILEDDRYQRIPTLCPYRGKTTTNQFNAVRNDPKSGPRFGGNDIAISDKANRTHSTSCMDSYNFGKPASTLAGSRLFLVKDYEVFGITLAFT